MYVEWKIVTGDPQVTGKLTEFTKGAAHVLRTSVTTSHVTYCYELSVVLEAGRVVDFSCSICNYVSAVSVCVMQTSLTVSSGLECAVM